MNCAFLEVQLPNSMTHTTLVGGLGEWREKLLLIIIIIILDSQEGARITLVMRFCGRATKFCFSK